MRAGTVQTKRLILAPLREQDARDLHEVRGDPEGTRSWDGPQDETPAVTEAVVSAFYLPAPARGREFFWEIRRLADGQFVGVCDLGDLGGDGSAEIGFLLTQRFWGKGLGHEAPAGLVQAARELGLQCLGARVHAGKERSIRLLLRLGFREIEPLPNFEIRPGIRRDCRRFELYLVRQEAPACPS